jgi:hypothetical protein
MVMYAIDVIHDANTPMHGCHLLLISGFVEMIVEAKMLAIRSLGNLGSEVVAKWFRQCVQVSEAVACIRRDAPYHGTSPFISGSSLDDVGAKSEPNRMMAISSWITFGNDCNRVSDDDDDVAIHKASDVGFGYAYYKRAKHKTPYLPNDSKVPHRKAK